MTISSDTHRNTLGLVSSHIQRACSHPDRQMMLGFDPAYFFGFVGTNLTFAGLFAIRVFRLVYEGLSCFWGRCFVVYNYVVL